MHPKECLAHQNHASFCREPCKILFPFLLLVSANTDLKAEVSNLLGSCLEKSKDTKKGIFHSSSKIKMQIISQF